MLGFEAGVAVTAEETRKKLIEAFESPMSKFRGASKELATTWEGVMSMIGDKWFNIRSVIADAGLFNYFKAIAMAIDDWMGTALDNTKKQPKSFQKHSRGPNETGKDKYDSHNADRPVRHELPPLPGIQKG